MSTSRLLLVLTLACCCSGAKAQDLRTPYLDFLVGKHTATAVFHRLETGDDIEIVSKMEGVYRDGYSRLVVSSVTASKSVPGNPLKATSTWMRKSDHYEATLVDDEGHTNVDKMYVTSPGHYHTDGYYDGVLLEHKESEVKDGVIVEKGEFMDASGKTVATMSATIK